MDPHGGDEYEYDWRLKQEEAYQDMALPLPPPQTPQTSATDDQLEAPGDNTSGQPHKRNYQACIPCRKRKVKCNLGPVDNPHDPPCQRCRREAKECYFSSTRRKRKSDEFHLDDVDSDEPEPAESGSSSRKRAKSDLRFDALPHSYPGPSGLGGRYAMSSSSEDPPLTPGGNLGMPKPLTRPNFNANPNRNPNSAYSDDEEKLNSDTAALLQNREVYSGHDALDLLAAVAGQSSTQSKRRRTLSAGNLPRPQFLGDTRSHTSESGRIDAASGSVSIEGRLRSGATAPLSASITPPEARFEGMPGLDDAVDAWKKLRFVRAGWFTTHEGIAYIDYFYRYLHPLTPITLPDFQKPSTHDHLLRHEPMLTVTLLAVSSRYMPLSGHGARTRAFAIHEKLWSYLRDLIDRMNWSQEHFSTASHSELPRPVPFASAEHRGLRTIGSIESLLMLTEWHPRSLHFPPGNDNDELIVGEDRGNLSGLGVQRMSEATSTANAAALHPPESNIRSWLEPCWKSDRLCWSLLGNALTLAYEVGVMSPVTSLDKASQRRIDNVRRLLYIYMTQTSGRLDLPSMISETDWASRCSDDSIDRAVSAMDFRRVSDARDVDMESPKVVIQNVCLHFWYKIAHLFYIGNKELFPSRDYTNELVSTGKYTKVLDELALMHRGWRKELDHCMLVPMHMRYVLIIEYEYMRVYGNCLALQAVVERCAKMGPKTRNNVIHPNTLSKCFEGDRKYITEIVTCSQNLLKCIIDGLLPDDYLKHAPVRTYFRVIAVSMVLLKTFALGATQDDISYSLSLLDQAVHALKVCIVDDVHIGSRFAELLNILAQRVRSRMVRVSRGAQSSAASRAGSSTPASIETRGRGHARESPAHRSGSSTSISDRRGTAGPAPVETTWQRTQQQRQQQLPPMPSTQTWNPDQSSNQHQWLSNQNLLTYQPSSRAVDAFAQYAQRQPADNTLNTNWLVPQGWPPSDPLRGISPSLPYDPNNRSTSNIMPPPAATDSYYLTNPNTQYNTSPRLAAGYETGSSEPAQQLPSSFMSPSLENDPFNLGPYGSHANETWCALPLDPILSAGPVNVTHSGFGPDIGGQDMLDLLLLDDNSREGPEPSL